ncbi:hypothetical protein PAPYR_11214 [Paratrimastix pyriformis]|uniref:Uncharacterized protein n=1 Tax=Paratrimastix pyriformis TaxID=342808 RepID=A0ABQ8U751_9EUKA|nr:hypothetical protein PAPYR_11214 [Paratrimastix pyriformis]
MKNEKAERPAEEEKIISAWEAANIDISEKCIEILAGERIRPEKVSRIDRLFELVPTIPVGDRPSLMDHFPNLSLFGMMRHAVQRRSWCARRCRPKQRGLPPGRPPGHFARVGSGGRHVGQVQGIEAGHGGDIQTFLITTPRGGEA